MTDVAIEVLDLNRTFGARRALQGVSLSLVVSVSLIDLVSARLRRALV